MRVKIVSRFLAFGFVAALFTGSSFAGADAGRLSLLQNAPIYFEANFGQAESGKFVARGSDCSIALGPTQAELVLAKPSADSVWAMEGRPLDTPSRSVRLTLEGANANAKMTGLEQMSGRVNYLIGNDSAEWRTGVPLFARVHVAEVYHGIDLIYYANQSARLEYDFILQPWAKPDQISFQIDGADRVKVDSSGDLVLKIGGEEIRQARPVLYQTVNGVRKPVRGGYRIVTANTVRFWTGDYDRSLPLVIDPTLNFLTYLGGNKADRAWSIAIDAAGNAYVAGETLTKKFAMPGAFQTNYNRGIGQFGDAFVAKYGSASNELVYLTYLGGKTDDGAFAIAVDDAGHAFVTGFSDSKNFPTTPTNSVLRPVNIGVPNNAFQIPDVDAFVVELETNGSSLVFSTLIGGTRRDVGKGIAVTKDGGDVFVTGFTESIVTNNLPNNTNITFAPIPIGYQTNNQHGAQDAFVARLQGGTNSVYFTFLGGTNLDSGESIAIDGDLNAYVTGSTTSTNFPMTNALVINGLTLTNLNGATNFTGHLDAFVAKISPDGGLLYSSYLGGSNDETGMHIAVDLAKNVIVTGYTMSTNFPTNLITSPVSGATNFTSHVFVTKIGPGDGVANVGGTNVIFSTEFGGTGSERGLGVAVDTAGAIYVTGFFSSTNFFATNSLASFQDLRSTNALTKAAKKTPNDIFIAVIDPSGSNFIYGAYLGGSKNDQGNGIAVDPAGGFLYVAGETFSIDLPTTNVVSPGLVQTKLGGQKKGKLADAVVGKITFP